jgi:hypothetical protein
MTSQWDIFGDSLPGPEVVEKCAPSRRSRTAPSSAVFAVLLAVSTAGVSAANSGELVAAVSSSSVVLAREPIKRTLPSDERTLRAGVDFEVGRSAEQLARSFQAHFGPASDHDEDDQVGYVFN